MGREAPKELTAGNRDDDPDTVLAMMPHRWHGVVALEGVPADNDDGRMLAAGAIEVPDHGELIPPLNLMAPHHLTGMARGTVEYLPVGKVDQLWREPFGDRDDRFEVWAAGTVRPRVLPLGRPVPVEIDLDDAGRHMDMNTEAFEAAQRGEPVEPGTVLVTFRRGRLAAVTIGNRPLWSACHIRRTGWKI